MKSTYENKLVKAEIQGTLVNGPYSRRGNKREGLEYMFFDNGKKTLFWQTPTTLKLFAKENIAIFGYVTAGDAERRDLSFFEVVDADTDAVYGVFAEDITIQRGRNSYVEFDDPIIVPMGAEVNITMKHKGKDRWNTNLIQIGHLDIEEWDEEIPNVEEDIEEDLVEEDVETELEVEEIRPIFITVKFSDGSVSEDIPLE